MTDPQRNPQGEDEADQCSTDHLTYPSALPWGLFPWWRPSFTLSHCPQCSSLWSFVKSLLRCHLLMKAFSGYNIYSWASVHPGTAYKVTLSAHHILPTSFISILHS